MKTSIKALATLVIALYGLMVVPSVRAEPVPNANGLPPGEIFILGTPHLFDIKDKYDPSILAPLLKRLENFNPDLIAIEALRGEDIAAMELRPTWHNDVLKSYAWSQRAMGGIAQAELGIDWSVAQDTALAGVNVDKSNDFRTDAILQYLAAYDYFSALLTWYRGSPEFREAFAEKHDQLADNFEKRLESTNEFYSIALPLAGKLGHDRLYPVDNHSEAGAMDVSIESVPGGWDSLMAFYGDIKNHPFLVELNSRFETAAKAGDVVPYYRWLNLPETGIRDEAFQWDPLMSQDNDSRIGSLRLAGWETRNLRIAANISELMIANPGKRVLFIVGSGHKPILDRLFNTMNWIRVVPSEEVLGPES